MGHTRDKNDDCCSVKCKILFLLGAYILLFGERPTEVTAILHTKLVDSNGSSVWPTFGKTPECAAAWNVITSRNQAGFFNWSNQTHFRVFDVPKDPLAAAFTCFTKTLNSANSSSEKVLRGNGQERFATIFKKQLYQLTESLSEQQKVELARSITSLKISILPGSSSSYYLKEDSTEIEFFAKHYYSNGELRDIANKCICHAMSRLGLPQSRLTPCR